MEDVEYSDSPEFLSCNLAHDGNFILQLQTSELTFMVI